MTITIPDNYKWLLSITDLPRTIEEALKRYNVIEAPGPPDNPTIMGWRDELLKAGVNVKDFTHDSVPWCGLFAAIVVFHRMNDPKEVVEDPLWALNWAKYGVKSDRPSLGDVLTFVRNGGGHVGFYVGEDSSCYHVYGGNQSDHVCFTRVPKERLHASRRPKYKVQPASVKPYFLAATGAVSTKEQ